MTPSHPVARGSRGSPCRRGAGRLGVWCPAGQLGDRGGQACDSARGETPVTRSTGRSGMSRGSCCLTVTEGLLSPQCSLAGVGHGGHLGRGLQSPERLPELRLHTGGGRTRSPGTAQGRGSLCCCDPCSEATVHLLSRAGAGALPLSCCPVSPPDAQESESVVGGGPVHCFSRPRGACLCVAKRVGGRLWGQGSAWPRDAGRSLRLVTPVMGIIVASPAKHGW